MRKLVVATIAVLTVLTVTGVAAGAPNRFGQADFAAELSGAQEVPPVATDASGEAKIVVRGDALDFELEIADATDILGAAGAHIHCAPAGQNGPVVAFLAAAVPGGFDGDVELKASLTEANIVNPECGSTIAELLDAMADGRTYVNVHSPAHPAGEIRGQLLPV